MADCAPTELTIAEPPQRSAAAESAVMIKRVAAEDARERSVRQPFNSQPGIHSLIIRLNRNRSMHTTL